MKKRIVIFILFFIMVIGFTLNYRQNVIYIVDDKQNDGEIEWNAHREEGIKV